MWGQCGSKFRIGKTRSLSRLVCVPRFFVSFASSQASRVFRLVYRPYRSFRFVFSSLVVSTSFVSFASRFVLCLTFSFFVLLFSFNLFLLNKQFSFLYEFVSSCEVLLTPTLNRRIEYVRHGSVTGPWTISDLETNLPSFSPSDRSIVDSS